MDFIFLKTFKDFKDPWGPCYNNGNLLPNIICSAINKNMCGMGGGGVWRGILDKQERQTRPNSGGVAEGQPSFNKGGGGCNIFFIFTHYK